MPSLLLYALAHAHSDPPCTISPFPSPTVDETLPNYEHFLDKLCPHYWPPDVTSPSYEQPVCVGCVCEGGVRVRCVCVWGV